MNTRDEEIQKNIEGGRVPDSDSIDVRAYRQVFRALEKDPAYALPDRFAERVVRRLAERKQGRDARDHFWFGAGIFFITIAFLATILFTGVRVPDLALDLGFLKAMADYKGLALFGVLFILVLHVVDRRLIRRRYLH